MKKYCLLLFAFLFGLSQAFCQAEKIDSALLQYGRNYQQEKIYIQFDKTAYTKGETIWFKSYLFAGAKQSDISKNFYVDFFDASGKLLKHFITPVFQSSAKGQFDIPTDYKGGMLHIKAYTKWMLNFDSAFLYDKDILVIQGKDAKPVASGKGVSAIAANASKTVGNINNATSTTAAATFLTFFPEGGDLVEGLSSKLAFLAVDQFGKPVNVAGAIITGKGDVIDSFATQHDGMGSLMITPNEGETYLAKWQDAKGKLVITQLPLAKKMGANISVQPFSKKAVVLLNRTEIAEENLKTLHLVAQMNQQLIYRAKINLTSKSSVIAEIPTDNLNNGILQITVFNNQLIPVAERIIFVNNHNYDFITDVNVEVKNLAAKGKNIVELSSPDTIPTNLSVSITDADIDFDKNNIFSQLLLCDDIKGTINNPAYYFESKEDSVKKNLDLVMLTHGWRRFDWANALSENKPILPNGKDNDYIEISGKTYIPTGVTMAPDQKIVLILQAKDSSKQMLTVPLEKDGSFVLHGAVFFDTMRVFYQYLGDKKLERKSELTFQNGFVKPLKGNSSFNYQPNFLGGFNDTSAIKRAERFAAKQFDYSKSKKENLLQNVTVKANARTQVDLLDAKYSSGLFANGDAIRYDLTKDNDPRASVSGNVFDYLRGLIGGLSITQNPENFEYSVTWRREPTLLYLNEVQTDPALLETVNITEVAFIKVFRPPFFGAALSGAGGAIAIYTRRGGDVKPDTTTKLSYKFIEGYSAFKQFYSPGYAGPSNFTPDVRATLYWKPYLILDANNRKQKIEFYNNDISKKLRVIVEGVDAQGKLTRTEKIIE